MKRIGAIAVIGLACAGCADSSAGTGLNMAGMMRLSGNLSGAETATEASEPGQRTLATKVMSAIALEKVTGRKPDPARLMQVD